MKRIAFCSAFLLVLVLMNPAAPAWSAEPANLDHDRDEAHCTVDLQALQRQALKEGWTFTVGENPATRYRLDELCGLVPPENWRETARFARPTHRTLSLPSAFDWRDVTGCPPVKMQGGCGSCWAFGTVGPLECNIMIKHGIEVDLSEQWLVSCNSNGWGCDGGWWAHDHHQARTDSCGGSGAVLEEHLPYTATDAPCGCPYPHDYWIDDWAYIETGDNFIPAVDDMKQAIMQYGPVSVSVCSNSAFHAYTGGVFNGPSCSGTNHGVVLVGWDDSQGENGVWILRNSWGPGWGEGGYMRIEYGVCEVGYGAAFVDYLGASLLRLALPDGTPGVIPAGQPVTIDVRIEEVTDTYVAGSGTLHYRYGGGAYLTSPLVHVGGDLYRADLPPAACGDTPEYYFTAEGLVSGTNVSPVDAPASVYASQVGAATAVFDDDFETDRGWTVQNVGSLTDGAWERGVPAGDGERGDPVADYDGSGSCYLTANDPGNSDVDYGGTRLISPAFDLSGTADAMVSYAISYSNNAGSEPDNDVFTISVSNDAGATWVPVDTIGPETPMPVGWREYTFLVADLVSTTDQVRVRFEAYDENPGSVVEAAVDDFHVAAFECGATVDPNLSFVDLTHEETGGLVVCPDGDGPVYRYLQVTVRDGSGAPIEGISADRFSFELIPAGGSLFVGPPPCNFTGVEGATDASGEIRFEIAGDRPMLGDTNIEVTVAGVPLNDLDVLTATTFDLNLDGIVDLVDFARYALAYETTAAECDFDWSGYVDLGDLIIFADHYMHGDLTMTTAPEDVGLSKKALAILESFKEISPETREIAERMLRGKPGGGRPDESRSESGISMRCQPNPLEDVTTVTYAIPVDIPVRMTVHDVQGRVVRTLIDSHHRAGTHRAVWRGDDDAGRKVSPGIYFIWLDTGADALNHRMVLVK